MKLRVQGKVGVTDLTGATEAELEHRVGCENSGEALITVQICEAMSQLNHSLRQPLERGVPSWPSAQLQRIILWV